MNKLRSDSAFCQLTPQQTDTLEGWLFEERLGYPTVLEKLKAEFGLETSLTGVRRFYKRLEMERSRLSLMDAVESSGVLTEALKGGSIKPGILLLANKCLFELLLQSPTPIKEVTTLLRTITSAESRAMRQTVFEREESERKETERRRQARESWRMTPQDLEEEKAQLEAEKAAEEGEKSGATALKIERTLRGGSPSAQPSAMSVGRSPSPQPSPPGEGELTPTIVASDARKEAQVVGPGGRGCGSQTRGPGNGTAAKDAGGAWQPSVVVERAYAESYVAQAAENRLTPLNAA